MSAFYNFQLYPNTYYTKFRCTPPLPPKTSHVTPKNELSNVQLPFSNM